MHTSMPAAMAQRHLPWLLLVLASMATAPPCALCQDHPANDGLNSSRRFVVSSGGNCTPPRSGPVKPFCVTPTTASPQAQQQLAHTAAAAASLPSGSAGQLSPEQVVAVRAGIDAFTASFKASAQPYIARTANATLGGVPVVWIHPNSSNATADATKQRRAILYLHGGGYVGGSCATLAGVVAATAAALGVPVVCPEYRLAPEHPFPAGLDDAYKVFQALQQDGGGGGGGGDQQQQTGGHSYSHDQLAVVGDSAGGGMAAALAVKARQRGDPLPGALGLISPYVDLCTTGDTAFTLAGLDVVGGGADPSADPCGNPLALAYAPRGSQGDPLASPLRADWAALFAGQGGELPPSLIQVGTRETLLSQAVLLYRAMRAAAPRPGNVVLSPYDAMVHDFQVALELPEAQAAQREMAEFLRRAFDGSATC